MVLLLFVNLYAGSVPVPLKEVLRILCSDAEGSMAADIVLKIRFPRALSALFLGGALALSGYLLQTFFHNPIAGPFVLGISSGAKLCVAIVMIASARFLFPLHSLTLIIAAFCGALIAMGFVLLLSARVNRMSLLIVAGIMIGYICSAVTDFAVTFAEDAQIVNLHNWTRGSFSGMNWENVRTIVLSTVSCLAGILLLAKPISAYQMGEEYAQSLGVNVRRLRVLLILLSSLLAAVVSAFAGPVSFVGIAVPHLVKRLLKTARPLVLIPACFLGGGIFCLGCDVLARCLFAPTELSISTVTAVFGAPVVLVVMLRRQKERL
ncbi:MAG: iron ABC transporter permease [Lachnospiraceae bacterium]|nr:iron ABC transporter permease [Lachnospiraceae bacterium]